MKTSHYRIWTKDINGITCMSDWMGLKQCKKFAIARWNHIPSFVYFSKAVDKASFIRYNGE